MLAMQGAIASERAVAPDERPQRFARGLGIAERCANGASAGRMRAAYPPSVLHMDVRMARTQDACERPIRHPLLSY
jgi:hypothetical protein